MTDTKYFAYYIPSNKPTLMNNIVELMIKEYGQANHKHEYNRVDANINCNDWEETIGEGSYNNLKSLVLVKMTNLNDMFIRNELDESKIQKNTHNSPDTPERINLNDKEYILVSENTNMYRHKYNNGENAVYKMRQSVFSGTQNQEYIINEDTNYILVETILIPLTSILLNYQDIKFDCVPLHLPDAMENTESYFTKSLNMYLEKGKMDDIRVQLIFKIMNDIIKKLEPSGAYNHMKHYIPLLPQSHPQQSHQQQSQNNVEMGNCNYVLELWNILMSEYNDPLKFLQDHKLIINNNILLEKVLYRENCKLNAKLYITEKNFADITYKDALPYKTFFLCNENMFTNSDNKHNHIAMKIDSLQNRIDAIKKNIATNMAKTIAAHKETETTVKKQGSTQIATIQIEIAELETKLTPIDQYYKEHLLHKTNVGVRAMFNEQLNSYRALVFLRMIGMHIGTHKDLCCNKFKFKYQMNGKIFDIFKFYVDKDLLKDIICLNIKADLFSISRIFYIKMNDKYKDDKANIADTIFTPNAALLLSATSATPAISTTPATSKLESIAKLNAFIKKNIAMDLIYHQKNNILWMLKLEDQIYENKLFVTGFVVNINIDCNAINDIRLYIHRLKSLIPESFLKNYVITYEGEKYLIDIDKDASIAKVVSLVGLLNANNNRSNGYAGNSDKYDYNLNIVSNIITKEEYLKSNTQNIQLCGGALCDEVGLGKTLSIISHLIAKMKNDMLKYSRYKSRMADLLPELDEKPDMNFVDPLETGFEYNNLIIVPSRLTSQWESEIEKYCKDKFKLRVKVLVSITAIKNLEKELHEFYNTSKDPQSGTDNNKPKKTTSKSKKQSINSAIKKDSDKTDSSTTKVSQKPIINTNIQIDEIQINDSDIHVSASASASAPEPEIKKKIVKKTKEQIMIDKLMEKAKKANERKNKNKTSQPPQEPIQSETTLIADNSNTYASINKIELPIAINNNDVPLANSIPIAKGITFNSILNNSILNNNLAITEDKQTMPTTPTTLTTPIAELPEDNTTKETKEADEGEEAVQEDIYSYINPYLDCDESGADYYEDQLYDVYIVSVNLLSNDNYLEYITHNYENHLRPFVDGIGTYDYKYANAKKIQEFYNGNIRKICRMTDKFNIFKIKWNRITLDEAHEKLNPVVKMFSTSLKNYLSGHHKINHEDQYLYENLVFLKSNYKWALTGTPSQSGLDNIMGIMQFLTKKNIFENYDKVVQKVRYFSNLIGISRENMENILKQIFKKTFKKDVRQLLNIPLFSEEIIYLEQTNIERNIYNTIRASRHFTEAVKLRRLFLMCTNILINEGYDFDSHNDITVATETLTLEQLNANMIAKFTEQLKLVGMNETRIKQANELLQTRIIEWENVAKFIEDQKLDDKIAQNILTELNNNFANLDKASVRINAEVVYNLLDIFTAYKDPSAAGMILFTNLINLKSQLSRIWRVTWENEQACTKIAHSGAKLGCIKSGDEIHRNNRKLETIATDKKRINNQIALFSNNEFLKEKTTDPCIICFEDLTDVVVTPCRHIFCLNCTKHLSQDLKNNFSCPECRTPTNCKSLNITTVAIINGEKKDETIPPQTVNTTGSIQTPLEKKLGSDWKTKCINKYGSKMACLVEYLHNLFENAQNRVIIFSQYDKMLKMIGKTLDEFSIKFVYCQGNNFVLNKNINKFKKDDSIRVIMLSSETSNSGSNLTEANYIIFIDVLFQDQQHVKATEAQAIGRAVRLGQKLPVKVVRFITRGTIEDEHFQKNRYDMNSLQE